MGGSTVVRGRDGQVPCFALRSSRHEPQFTGQSTYLAVAAVRLLSGPAIRWPIKRQTAPASLLARDGRRARLPSFGDLGTPSPSAENAAWPPTRWRVVTARLMPDRATTRPGPSRPIRG